MPEQTNPSQPISSYQLVRWARQERSALMAAYLRSAAAYLAASLGGLVRYFGEFARRLGCAAGECRCSARRTIKR